MKTSEEIIQELLDKKYITVSEAMTLLRDIARKENVYDPVINKPYWLPTIY